MAVPPLEAEICQLIVACVFPATVDRFAGAAAGPNGTTDVFIGVP